MSPDLIERMLSTIEDEGRGLSPWEDAFIESLREQFSERGRISERQAEILEGIYSEKTP